MSHNRRASADQSDASYASMAHQGSKNFRLRNGRGKRNQSLPGVKESDKIKLEVPQECKVLCFCQ